MSVYQRASVSQIIRVIIYDILQLDNHDNDNTSSIPSEEIWAIYVFTCP
jgi:hypothetical protein